MGKIHKRMIQLLPGIRIKAPSGHSTYGRVKVKTIQLFLGKYKVHIEDKRTKGQNLKSKWTKQSL